VDGYDHEARRVRLGTMGRWRIHGSGDFVHWFNFDVRRPRKDSAIVIHLDGAIRRRLGKRAALAGMEHTMAALITTGSR
jgi:hypothetical protein